MVMLKQSEMRLNSKLIASVARVEAGDSGDKETVTGAEGQKDHMMIEKAEVSSQLEGVKTDLVNVRHCVRQLEHISWKMPVTKLISWNGSWRCYRETFRLLVLKRRLRRITGKS